MILISPRQTEKAVLQENRAGVYTFNVEDTATKTTIAKAIKEAYKVSPLKVNIVRTPATKKWIRGKWGVKRGGKKAYVFLKKGDKIAI